MVSGAIVKCCPRMTFVYGGEEYAPAEDGGYGGMKLIEWALVLILVSFGMSFSSVAFVVRLLLSGSISCSCLRSRVLAVAWAAFWFTSALVTSYDASSQDEDSAFSFAALLLVCFLR